MIAQPKPETTRRVKPAPLPPVPFVRPERLVATVEKGGAELPLAGVTAVDLATLADAQRRADARRIDFEDRIRMLQAADAKLAGILAELEAAEAEVEAVTAKLDAGLSADERMAGTSKVELPGVVMVTFPAPRMVFKAGRPLAEAYEHPVLRRAMRITCEPTKPPRLKIKLL